MKIRGNKKLLRKSRRKKKKQFLRRRLRKLQPGHLGSLKLK